MPPDPLLWLVVCWMFFLFSAEICVVSGCSFAVICFTNHGDFGAAVVGFGTQNMKFGILIASNFGTLGDHRAFQGDSGGILGAPWAPLQ